MMKFYLAKRAILVCLEELAGRLEQDEMHNKF